MLAKIKLVGAAFALLAAASTLAACKGGDESGSGGATSTSTTTNTGTGCDACWPQCFMDMFAPCSPEGACTSSQITASGGFGMNVCYANGVKLGMALSAGGADMTYYKADGSVCFTASSTITATETTATYKDTSGAVIMTDTTPSTGGAQKITCGGQTYTVDPASAACQACATQPGGTSTCTDGTCAVP